MSRAAAIAGHRAEIIPTLAALARTCLRLPHQNLTIDTPLALAGLDSLGVVELSAAVERSLSIRVPCDVIVRCGTVRSIASEIERRQDAPGGDARSDVEQMLADADLPADVQPRPSRNTPATSSLIRARNILLTGATGFVGAFLLKELLARTSARIHCLVRPAGEDPERRLHDHLASLAIVVPKGRVMVVTGDLERPLLGLSTEAFERLAQTVDAICHAGAAVNWVFGYDSLRAANVLGTVELLRMACRAGATPFHFVSSLSVCYPTSAPPTVDERFDPLPHLQALHLGYAQSKAVAEALVAEAGARGLSVKVYRPSLVISESRTGLFNPTDLLASLIPGCLRMGTAPDLDWRLDAVPVDILASAIVDLSAEPGRTFHLAHRHPRHWRECVLWMRLYGYPIQLVTYHAWLRQLERETASTERAAADHPLRALRSFFLDRPRGADGFTLPELYEERRRARADTTWTDVALDRAGLTCPPLDASFLDRCFSAFIGRGHISRPPSPLPVAAGCVPPPRLDSVAQARRLSSPEIVDTAFFNRLLDPPHQTIGVRSLAPIGQGADQSIVSELTAWRSRRPVGLFRVVLEHVPTANARTDSASKARPRFRRVVLKLKPECSDVIDVGEALAGICDPHLVRAYARHRPRLGLDGGDERELAIYRQTDVRFTRHAPALLGGGFDPVTGSHALVLEDVGDAAVIDSASRSEAWGPKEIGAAIRGLAALQSVWFDRTEELRRQPWVGHVRTARTVVEMTDLWDALAAHARPRFSAWIGPTFEDLQRRLIERVPDWWPVLEAESRTLLHNDFNSRNICLRRCRGRLRLCAYDWELAAIGAPQRDLAELLCFVLDPSAIGHEAWTWVDLHRRALERETGCRLNAATWREGFRAALFNLMIDRLPLYALINRVRPQSFLPRVVRAWSALYRRCPL